MRLCSANASALLVVALIALSCDRERSNPLDFQGDSLRERPATPAAVIAEPGIGLIRLRWQPVTSRSLAGYAVLRADDSAAEYELLAGEGSAEGITTGKTSFVDSLESFPGRTFFYRVAAVDTTGLQSEATNFVGATVVQDNIPPGPPQNLTAIPNDSDAGVSLVWAPPVRDANGGELTGLEGYSILRAEAVTGGAVPIDSVAATAREYVDVGLKPLTTYNYAVIAFDRFGNASTLAILQVTTAGMPIPVNLSAQGSAGRIVVNWAPVADEELLGYNVFRSERPDEGFERLNGMEGTPFTTGRTTYVDSGLVGGQLYYYKVQSVGTDISSELSPFVDGEARADEVPPEPPRNLSAVADETDFGRVVVTWNAPLVDSDGRELTGLAGYVVFRSQGSADSFVRVAGVTDLRFEDSGLEESKTYLYTVVAVDGEGNESGRALLVQVRTQGEDRIGPAPPRNVSAVPDEVDFGRVVVTWSAPLVDSDGGELTGLTGYELFRSEGSTDSFVPVASVTDLRFEDSGLGESKTYFYTVVAVDGEGNESGRALPIQVRTQGEDRIGPGPPRNVSAVPDEVDFGRVVVTWSAPLVDSDGGELTGLTGYELFRSEGSTDSFVPVASVTDLRFEDSGLGESKTYFYTVVAVDGEGNESGRALPVQVRTQGEDRIGPGPPRNVSAVPDEVDFGRVVVTWSAPLVDSDGGELTGLTGYELFRSEGSTDSFVPVASVTDLRFEDSGLGESKTYFYTVVAVDGEGNESGRALPVQVRTQGEDRIGPGPPRNVSAVPDEVDFGRVVVTWSAPLVDSDGGELTGLVAYAVFRSEESTASFVRVAGVTDLRFEDTGLDESKTYFYTVVAVDAEGNESGRANPVQVRTQGEDSIGPGAPRNVSAVADQADRSRITVRWSAPIADADGGELSGLAGFIVFRSESGVGGFVPVDTLAASVRQFEDAGLRALTAYAYTVVAFDETGNESAQALSSQARTAGISVPVGLSATEGIGQITVTWRAVADDDLIGYDLFRSTRPDTGFERLQGIEETPFTTGRTSYIDSNVVVGQLLYYKVQAVGSVHRSELSAFVDGEVQADEVPPATARNLSAVADDVDFGRVVVTWTEPQRDASGDDLTGLSLYRVLRSAESTDAFVEVATVTEPRFEDGGLEEFKVYFYTVVAVDLAGNESVRAAPVRVQTEGVDRVAPRAPQNVSAVAVEDDASRIILNWSLPTTDADGGELTGLAGFAVLRSEGGARSFVPVDTLAADISEFIDVELRPLTLYVYSIVAFDEEDNESQPSASTQATTAGIPVPTGLSASDGIGRIEVRWRAIDDEDLVGYDVYRSDRPDTGFVRLEGTEGTPFTTGRTSYIDSNLVAGQLYYYKVQAMGEMLRSELSAFADGESLADEVAPNSPSDLSAVADEIEFGRVTLTWTEPLRDADGGELTGLSGYAVFRSQESASSFTRVAAVTEALYEDLGLEEFSTYFYTVVAVDSQGNESGRAAFVSVTTFGEDRTGPAAPQNVSAVADEIDTGRIVVRWSAPTTDADGGELTGLAGFAVLRSEGGTRSFVPVDTLAADVRSYEDVDLRALTLYAYTVVAFDEGGNESVQAASFSTQTGGIAVPLGVAAVGGFGRITLSWRPVNDAELIGYNIYRSSRPDLTFAKVDSPDSATFTTGQTSYVDSNLAAAELFYYRVTAVSSETESEQSAFVSAEALEDDSPPATPSDIVAIAETRVARITLSWSGSRFDQNGGDLTGLQAYIIFRSEGTPNELVVLDTVAASITEYVDSNLESATIYYYSLSSLDDDGNASRRSNAASATTQGISQPTSLAASAGIRLVTLSWAASGDDNLIGYNVYRSNRTDQGFERLLGVEGTSFTTGQTAYIDSGLAGGDVFFYRISVVTDFGESSLSAFDGATVLSDSRAPAAPSLVSGESVNGDPERLLLDWRAPTTDFGGAFLTGLSSYAIYRADNANATFAQVGTSTTTSFEDTGLDQKTTYFYEIEALDAVGNASPRSATVSATTSGVGAPSNVTLSSTTPSNPAEDPTVTISWDGSSSAVLRYEVQRTTVANSVDDNDYEDVVPNDIRTSRDDSEVERGRTYYYRVRAIDGATRASDWTDPAAVSVSD